MLFRIKSFLNFLIRSTNQHRVHSPFVYTLVTLCFYDRKKRASYVSIQSAYKNNTSDISYKHAKLINRIVPYFNIENALIIETKSNFIHRIISFENSVKTYNAPESMGEFDLIYTDINNCKSDFKFVELLFSKIHNETIFIINSIHKSKENFDLWTQLVAHQKTTVTIEMYNLGFVFFRKEQVKEEFTLRV
ncbi:class I SAM-dependent methyltransferase [Aquimarina addita]|uniref:Class I SAM-dependent methyltransferase n=1 Tax=Aquimarina addita TaxID=870485 RepID=A0ABP7X8J1_9FLAO